MRQMYHALYLSRSLGDISGPSPFPYSRYFLQPPGPKLLDSSPCPLC